MTDEEIREFVNALPADEVRRLLRIMQELFPQSPA